VIKRFRDLAISLVVSGILKLRSFFAQSLNL
jgi:hypothetical protein